jgi:hypothetical protein
VFEAEVVHCGSCILSEAFYGRSPAEKVMNRRDHDTHGPARIMSKSVLQILQPPLKSV